MKERKKRKELRGDRSLEAKERSPRTPSEKAALGL